MVRQQESITDVGDIIHSCTGVNFLQGDGSVCMEDSRLTERNLVLK